MIVIILFDVQGGGLIIRIREKMMQRADSLERFLLIGYSIYVGTHVHSFGRFALPAPEVPSIRIQRLGSG